MKVIGTISSGRFLAEITQEEVEKVFDKHYATPRFADLKVGSEINLADGYIFRSDIRSACKSMEDAMKQFHRAQATLLRFSEMVTHLDTPERVEEAA